jgi:SAM-dependent methyltransferase
VAGLLTRSDGRFANTPEADRWLVRGRPDTHADSTDFRTGLWLAYSKIAESIRAGRSLAAHDYAAMSLDELGPIYGSLDRYTREEGRWLADTFDFSAVQSLLDAGGGSGGLAVTLTERHPQIRATVAELPSVIPISERFIREANATDRVGVLGVDLVAGPVPGSFDVAVLRNVLQLFEPEDARRIVRSVGAAVRPGGRIYILGFGLNDTREGPESGLWFDFGSIGYYEHGHAHIESEHRAWLEEAWFDDVTVRWDAPVLPLAIVARKRL